MPDRGRYSRDDLIRSSNLPKKAGRSVKLPKQLDDPIKKAEWQQQLADPAVPKILDLFCGAGGMSEGFVQQGFVIAAACDHDSDACKTFEANIATHVVCADIKDITEPGSLLNDLSVSSIDVIVGGPPCQGFSVYGRGRLGSLEENNQRDLLARNNLYQEFFRFVEKFLPSFFVMENVPMLLNFQNSAYIRAIQLECQRLGYTPIIQIIDATDYGVPQHRRRLFIIGNRIGKPFRWPYPTCKQPVTLQDAIGDLPELLPPSEGEYLPYAPVHPISAYQQHMRSRVLPEDRAFIYDHVVRPVREDDEYVFQHMKPGDRYIDIDPRYQRYNAETFRDKYYMLKPDKPGTTITAHIAKDGYRYIHWDTSQHRTLSVREAARIQSFGDHFHFSGSRTSRFRQVGNAVPPLIASIIAQQIYQAIKRNDGSAPEEQIIQLALPEYEQLNRPFLSPEIVTSPEQKKLLSDASSQVNQPQQVDLWAEILGEQV
jgi:DNA (cytosine-5)-methyltransferase 1